MSVISKLMRLTAGAFAFWAFSIILVEAASRRSASGTQPSPNTEVKPTCAVLTFDAGRGIHTGQAGLLANRFAVLLTKTGKYKVLPRFRMNQMLRAKGFNRAAYRSPSESAVAAGRILNAQYIFCGRVERREERYTLYTLLIDVQRNEVVKRLRSHHVEDLDEFIKVAAESNLNSLLSLKEAPEAIVKPSEREFRITREVPEPKEKPPPAKPTKKEVKPEPGKTADRDREERKVIAARSKPEKKEKPTRRKKRRVLIARSKPAEPEKIAEQKKKIILIGGPGPEKPGKTTDRKKRKILIARSQPEQPVQETRKPAVKPEPSKPKLELPDEAIVKAEALAELAAAAKKEVSRPGEAPDEGRVETKAEPETGPLPLETVPPETEREWIEELKRRREEIKDLVAGRLEIGTRITVIKLLTENKSTFLGSIDHLDINQNHVPYKIFADWLFSPRYGIELTWDRIEAATLASFDDHTDGNIILTGPIITIFARRPVDIVTKGEVSNIVPYAGIGIAILSASFDHVGWFHNGFSGDTWHEAQAGYNEWIASGAPPWPNGGYQRTMNMDDTIGVVLMAGCSADAWERINVDLYLRYMNVDVDTDFTLSTRGKVFSSTHATFPMSNYTLGLGLRYAF